VAPPQVIAIDGPVAVGKTSLGQVLARKLGYIFVDTGNMYRAITWKALKLGIPLEDEPRLESLTRKTKMEFSADSRLRVDGQPLGPELRSPPVEAGVPLVSRLPQVRQALVAQQRALARQGRVVMAGRDIGTVVLPQAQLKVFLTASPEERAQRRFLELKGAGQEPDYNAILGDLKRRDGMDSTRAVSPLRPAPDARMVDTEGIPLEEVVRRVLALMEGPW